MKSVDLYAKPRPLGRIFFGEKQMIKKTVGKGYRTSVSDILKLKTILSKQGFYEVPKYGITGYADKNLFSAIQKFQKAKGLKVTGVVYPDDDTDQAFDDDWDNDWDDEWLESDENPSARPPILRCPECGAPHGGSKGDLCPDCDVKQ